MPPFYDDDNFALYEKIKKADYDFDADVWDSVSNEAKNIIRSLLVLDPEKRMRPDELLKHPWITGEKVAKPSNALANMREWTSRRKL